MISRILSYKIFRYFIGGGFAALLDLSCLYLFVDIFHIHYLPSAILSFVFSFFFGFLFQKYITFSQRGGNHVQQGLLFFVFQLVGLGINLLLLSILVEQFGWYYMYVAIFSKFVVFIWNFSMNHFFNFK